MIGYEPKVVLQQGVADLIAWAAQQRDNDSVPEAMSELQSLGLIR